MTYCHRQCYQLLHHLHVKYLSIMFDFHYCFSPLDAWLQSSWKISPDLFFEVRMTPMTKTNTTQVRDESPPQPRSQGLFVVKHLVDRGHSIRLVVTWPNFPIYLENLLQKLITQEVARKIFQLYWKIWSCDNQPLPGPSILPPAPQQRPWERGCPPPPELAGHPLPPPLPDHAGSIPAEQYSLCMHAWWV